MGFSMVFLVGTTLGFTINVDPSSFSGALTTSSLYTLIWGVDLKKDTLDVLSKPSAMEFINMKIDIPNNTPTMATVVIRFEAMKYVVAMCRLIFMFSLF
jgi:hypothetical protein